MARHLAGYFVPPAILGCLAQVVPEHVAADCALGSTIQVAGENEDGDEFVFLCFVAAGFGARPNSDGPSTLQFPASISNTPVEVIETTSPLFVHEKALRPGSAGAGRFRGGFGQTIRFSVRTDRPFTYSCMMERLNNPPQGILGGGDGAPNAVSINGVPVTDGKRRYEVEPGSEILYALGGGAGLGRPEDRDRAAVLEDLENGLISESEAVDVYGLAPDLLLGTRPG
jgi:N-methylhydantoinase B